MLIKINDGQGNYNEVVVKGVKGDTGAKGDKGDKGEPGLPGGLSPTQEADINNKFANLMKKLRLEDKKNILDLTGASIYNSMQLNDNGMLISTPSYLSYYGYIEKYIPLEQGRVYYLYCDFPKTFMIEDAFIDIHFYNSPYDSMSLNHLKYDNNSMMGDLNTIQFITPGYYNYGSLDFRSFFIETEKITCASGYFTGYGGHYTGIPISVGSYGNYIGGFVFPKLLSALSPGIRIAFSFGINSPEFMTYEEMASYIKIVEGKKLW